MSCQQEACSLDLGRLPFWRRVQKLLNLRFLLRSPCASAQIRTSLSSAIDHVPAHRSARASSASGSSGEGSGGGGGGSIGGARSTTAAVSANGDSRQSGGKGEHLKDSFVAAWWLAARTAHAEQHIWLSWRDETCHALRKAVAVLKCDQCAMLKHGNSIHARMQMHTHLPVPADKQDAVPRRTPPEGCPRLTADLLEAVRCWEARPPAAFCASCPDLL